MFAMLLPVLMSSMVTVVFNALYYFLLLKPQTSLTVLKAHVDELMKKEICRIDTRAESGFASDSQARKGIYEHMRDKLMTRQECASQHNHIEQRFVSIERQLSGIRAEMTEIGKQTAGTQTIVKLIADHLHISLSDR